MAQIELYHFWDSFCSFKVRICLEEKGLSWTGHYIDLMAFENLKPDYLAVNKKAVVPTLRYDGKLIAESSTSSSMIDTPSQVSVQQIRSPARACATGSRSRRTSFSRRCDQRHSTS
jgi:hypothetical protein